MVVGLIVVSIVIRDDDEHLQLLLVDVILAGKHVEQKHRIQNRRSHLLLCPIDNLMAVKRRIELIFRFFVLFIYQYEFKGLAMEGFRFVSKDSFRIHSRGGESIHTLFCRHRKKNKEIPLSVLSLFRTFLCFGAREIK